MSLNLAFAMFYYFLFAGSHKVMLKLFTQCAKLHEKIFDPIKMFFYNENKKTLKDKQAAVSETECT